MFHRYDACLPVGDPTTETMYWAPFNHTVQAYMSLEVPNQHMDVDMWKEQCDMFDKFEGFPSYA